MSPLWPSDPEELRDAEGWGCLEAEEERGADGTKSNPRVVKRMGAKWINDGD